MMAGEEVADEVDEDIVLEEDIEAYQDELRTAFPL